MGVMEGISGEGRILRALNIFAEDPQNLLDSTLRTRLRSERLFNIREAFVVCNTTQVAHLREDWFDEKLGKWWWETLQPIEPIVQWGLIQALDQATAPENRRQVDGKSLPIPIQFLWTCDGQKFEVGVTWTPGVQVTLCIYSPPTPIVNRHPPMSRSSLSVFPANSVSRNEIMVKRIVPPRPQAGNDVVVLQDEVDGGGQPTGFIIAERQQQRP